MQDIVFIGSSSIGLKKLSESKYFKVVDCLCLSKRVDVKLEETSKLLNLELKTFDWIKDFKELIKEYSASTLFFIYQLDMLVPADLTKRNEFYNLHRGDLFENRGPSPDVWPILLGFETTKISLHQINDKIDSGILISTYEVEIERGIDTPQSVKGKLERGIPNLIYDLHLYLTGRKDGKELRGGEYRPWITEGDFTIDLNLDSIETIKRKILSQKVYNGAIIFDGKHKVYVNDFSENKNDFKKYYKVNKEDCTLYLKVNNNPHFSPPPKYPKSTRI